MMRNFRNAAIGLTVTVGVLFLLAGCSAAPSTQGTWTGSKTVSMSMADMPDYVQESPSAVQEAYLFAVTNPRALETVPCYCGCGALGHISNKNCFIKSIDSEGRVTFDSHASGCGICVDIARDVMRLTKEGRSAVQIRQYIDAQYGSFGPATNTPYPAA